MVTMLDAVSRSPSTSPGCGPYFSSSSRAKSWMKPTVSSLRSNHSIRTKGGRISAHSTGNAVDVSKINGIPISGHQGAGSIADLTVRRLLTLQGAMRPDQIISLMTYDGAPNTLALPDHANHIHIGFSQQADMLLKPSQWTRLLDRLGSIANPEISG